jgi:nitric oxide reductase NorD protein
MSDNPLKNIPSAEVDIETLEEELTVRFGEALSPLIKRFGYEGIDTIGLLTARLRQADRQSALALMDMSSDLVKNLLPYGEELVLEIFNQAHRLVAAGPYLTLEFLKSSPRILERSGYQNLIETIDLILEIAADDRELVISLIRKIPELIESAGFPGLEKVAFFIVAIAGTSRTYALKALESSPIISRQLYEIGGFPLVLAAYHLAINMVEDDWNCALEWIEKSPALSAQCFARGFGGQCLAFIKQVEEDLHLQGRMTLALLEAAPVLLERLGSNGLNTILRCASAMKADHSDKAATLIRESPMIIDRLLAFVTPGQVNEIFEMGFSIAAIGAEQALAFIQGSVELVSHHPFSTLKVVTDLAEEMAGTGRRVSEAFLKTAPALMTRVGEEGLPKIVRQIIPIAQDSWETASRLLLKSPDLLDRIGFEGLEEIGEFSAFLSRDNWTAAVQMLDKCPLLIDELLALGNVSLVYQVFRLGRRIAQTNARLAVSLLDRSPEIIGTVGFQGLETLTDMALHIGPDNWTAAVSLVEAAPQLLQRLNVDELKRISAVARILARENSYSAVSLLEKTSDWMDRLLNMGTKDQVLHLYDLVGEAAPLSWRLASSFFAKSPDLFSKLGAEDLDKVAAVVLRVAMVNGQVAVRLLDISTVMLDQIGFEGLGILSGLISLLARSDWMGALAALDMSPGLIDRLGQLGEGVIPPAVFDLAAKVAQTSPAAAVKLLEKSPDLIRWVGWEGFGKVAVFIELTAGEDEKKALSFLAGDSLAWTDFLENIPKGLDLKGIKPVLSHYLKALLGRRVEIGQADKSHTDGKKIYLPERIRDFQDQEENFIAFKVMATHLEAHLEYGSFEFDLKRIRDCFPGSTLVWKEETGIEGSDLERFAGLFPEPDLAKDLFNLLEDRRIENRLMNEYPALGKEITRMNLHQVSKRRSPRKMTNAKQRMVEMIGQALLAGRKFNDQDPQSGIILKAVLEWSESLVRPEADVHTAARLAVDLYRLIDEQFHDPYRPLKPLSQPLDQEKVTQNIGSFGKTSQQIQDRIRGRPGTGGTRSKTQPEAESGSEGDTQPTQSRPGQDHIRQRQHAPGRDQRTFRGPAGGGRPESGDPDQGGEETGGVGEAMKFDSREKIERLLKALHRERGITPREIERRMESLSRNELFLFLNNLEASLEKKTELESERGTTLYPEWGEDIQGYRENWARIREQTLPARSLDFYREVLDKHSGLLKKIRREFQMLKPEGFIRRKRQYDGDEIDLEAAVENWVDRKVGLSPSEKNYTLHQKKKRDIAVAFLIDMSRSTKGATIELEKEALIIMSEALSEVGDSFAVFGFSGDNRDNVDYYRIKSFDDPYDPGVKKRLSAVTDRFENRDGTAIRHTIGKLRKRPERTKLMILLSDGKPVDKEYSGPYAIEDTRLALKEALHYGIRSFCITVDRTAAEYLPRMYSHSSWTVIDEVGKLPEKITRIYRMLTA